MIFDAHKRATQPREAQTAYQADQHGICSEIEYINIDERSLRLRSVQ
jgi:hypothetical protein